MSDIEAEEDDDCNVHELAYDGDLEELQEVLSNNPERIEERDSKGRTVLSVAAGGGNVAIIEMLLSLGADQETLDDLAQSPLYWACINNKIKAVSCLIDHGASIYMAVIHNLISNIVKKI